MQLPSLHFITVCQQSAIHDYNECCLQQKKARKYYCCILTNFVFQIFACLLL